jgi:hypothetical protein
MTLKDRLEKIMEGLEEMKVDVEKCEEKGNRSAGVRVRKSCQVLREELKQLRAAVQELKKESE